MRAVKQRIAKFGPVAPFHNPCVADSVTTAASLPVFAGVIDTSAVESTTTDGQDDMKAIGGYIAGTLVILAAAGLIYSTSHKA